MFGSWLAYAAASNPDKLPYDASFWRVGASLVGAGLSAWLIHRRSRAALPTAVATVVGTAVLGVRNKIKHGTYVTPAWDEDSPKEMVFNRVMPVVQVAEAAALVGSAAHSAIERRKTGAATRPGPLVSSPLYTIFRKLGLYFMTFSLVGHWVEIAFCLGIKHGIFKGGYDRSNHMLWDQWLFPFPAEGTAAVLADLMLVPAKNAVEGAVNAGCDAGLIPKAAAKPLAVGASFLVNQAVCTSVDYGTGMVANRNYELWDYRDMRFNFQGQVCLQNSLFYSTIATWAVWWLLPVLERLMKRAGHTVLDGIFVGFGSFFAFLALLYGIKGDAE